MAFSINKEIDIQQFRNNWALSLMNQGIIVKLSLGRWGGTAPLKYDELGLKFNDSAGVDFMRKYVVLGHEKLLPPKIRSELLILEKKAREILTEHSFETVWGRFVPYSVFDTWKKENDSIKNDYLEAARVIGIKYDDIIQTIKDEYRKMAIDVWSRLYINQGEPTESFIQEFVSKVVAKIPSRNDMVASFKYNSTYSIIPLPSFIEENLRTEYDAIWKGDKKAENVILNHAKKRILKEYFERKQELIDNFLETTVFNLRNYISESCDDILMQIFKHASIKDINKTMLNRIKKTIYRIKLLNFYNDSEINDVLISLEAEVDKFKGERNKDVIIEKLQKISEICKKEFIPKDFNFSVCTPYFSVCIPLSSSLRANTT